MKSICPVCMKTIDAEKVYANGNVYQVKTCPDHGTYKTIIWQGSPAYDDWEIQGENDRPKEFLTEVKNGCPHDCGLCTEHEQEACCVLVEVTQRCNQGCLYCFAQSGDMKADEYNKDIPMDKLKEMFTFLISLRPDRPFNIQISGGEPTVREDLPEIIKMVKDIGFQYVQLNTNGKRLAEENGYTEKLKEAGLSSVFMQFDGTNDEIYEKIRGKALWETKQKAMGSCKRAELGVVLVMTVVPGINDDNIGQTIDYMLSEMPYARGIQFQPVSYFGRFPEIPKDEQRLTTPKLLRFIEEQTSGRIKVESAVPLSTGHPMCSFHGSYVLMEDGEILSISDENSSSCCCCGNEADAIADAREFIAKKWTFEKKESAPSSGDAYNFEEWDKFLNRVNNFGFSLTSMSFQDAWNMDLDRLKKCRVQVMTEDKKLIPFCAYNVIGYRENDEARYTENNEA